MDTGARTKGLKRDLDKAKGMAAKAAVVMQQELGRIGFRQAAIAAAAFAATFTFAMKKSLDAASDLEETSSKFNVVFAEQTQLAEENARTLVNSYLMSEREAKQYLSSVQDLLVPMGLAADQAANMSNEVVKLSADLGSFNNLPTAQVMLDIQSALVGNFETMKKYGVVLNMTVVAEKALAMGLAETKKELTAGQKAQAAYALMVEGSKAAIGDIARTSESYANQVKQLKANIEDISAEVGMVLLPIMSEYLKGINEWIKTDKINIEQIKKFVEALVEAAGAIGKVIEFGIAFGNVWTKTWQALGLASAGVMTYSEALLVGAIKVDEFNEKLKIQNEELIKNKEILDNVSSISTENLDKNYEITAEDKARYLELELTHNNYLAEIHEGHNARMAVLDEKRKLDTEKIDASILAYKKSVAISQLAVMRGLFTAGLQLAGVEGKKLFMIQKAIDIGIAVMSAYKAYSLALAHPPGPPTTTPLALTALKAGLWSAAAIAATSIGQMGAGGAGAAGGGTYVSPTITEVTEPVAELPEETERRGTVNINIEGDVLSQDLVDRIIEGINAAEDRDVYINQTNYAVETL